MMLTIEILLFLTVVAIGVLGYKIGLATGYDRGYFDGDQKRLQSLLPTNFRVVEPVYDHEKAGF